MTQNQDWMDLSDYLSVLRHSWLSIILCALLGLLAAAVVTSLQIPQYVAAVEMVLDRPAHSGLTREESTILARPDDTFYHTQTRILRSELLINRTINAIVSGALPHAPVATDFLPTETADTRESGQHVLAISLTPTLKSFIEDHNKTRLAQELAGGLLVDFLPRTLIFQIQTRSSNPEFAAVSANALAGIYAHYVSETFASTTERTFVLLQKQTEEATRQIKASAESLLAFKRNAEVTALTQAGTTNQTLDSRAREEIRQQLANTDSEIASLHASLAQMELNIKSLAEKYGNKHPSMSTALNQRRQILDRIEQLKDQVYANWEAKHIQEQTEIEYAMLEQDLEATRRLHDLLVGKMKEIDFTKESPVPTVKILKRAVVPDRPAYPRREMNLIMGALSGIMFGLVLAVLRARQKASRITVASCERLTSIPVIGWLPHFQETSGLVDVLTGADTASPDAEAFKALRTAVDAFSRPGSNVVLITSPERADGKSTVSAGLAQSFSRLNRHVLLIDGDLRRGRLHEMLIEDQPKGLSDYLAGDDSARPVSIHPSLDFLPCGQSRENPGEALASRRMEELILQLSQQYSIVIVDCPPLLPVTDAAILMRYADTRLMVIRCESTEIEALRAANRMVENLGHEFAGVILNDVKENKSVNYRYYRREYGSDSAKPATAR